MPEYPKHILDRAAEYHEAIVKDGPESAIHHIARAIVEQAERDAEISEGHASPGQMWERDEMPTAKLATGYAARDIASAIRNRVTQED